MAVAMRLAVVSVEGPDIERLQQLLDQVRGQLTRPWLWAASEAEADVLVIDVDSLYGHMDWLRAHGQGRRVICLTGRPGSEHDVTLTRPITAQGLLQDLRHFEAQARSQAAAAAAPPQADPIPAPQADPAPAPEDAKASEPVDPTLAAPAVVPPDPPPPAVEASRPAGTATQYRLTPRASPIVKARPQIVVEDHPAAPDPDRLTLADFCAIAALPEPAKLDRADAPTLVIDAERDCYYCSSPTLKPLLAYCNGTIARSEWQPVPVAEIEALRSNALVIHPLARLIWLHTLINSHGHLLAGLDYNARYRLTRWPQIEREFPKHFRIATVMMKGPVSLTEVADQAGATIPDVVDFVDAYTALGVVEPEGGGRRSHGSGSRKRREWRTAGALARPAPRLIGQERPHHFNEMTGRRPARRSLPLLARPCARKSGGHIRVPPFAGARRCRAKSRLILRDATQSEGLAPALRPFAAGAVLIASRERPLGDFAA